MSMDQAPPGWRRSTLGEIGTYLNGRGFKKSEWREAGRPIIRIQNLTGSSSTFNYFAGEAEDRYVARPGDLLMSWAATLGAYFWNGPEAVVNQHIFKVESKIDKRFHKYLLDFKLAELMRHTHGSGMVHITRGKFENVPVCVPDLAEQRRIVGILEDHLSRLEAAEHELSTAQRRVTMLRAAAFSRLMAYAEACEGTRLEQLGSISDVGTGTTPSRGTNAFYDAGTIPWITSGDLHQGVVTAASQFVTDKALRETSLRLYPKGTLLLAMYGEGKTRGTCAELALDATVNQACAAVQLRDPSTKAWVRAILDAQYSKMRAMAAGGVQPNLNLRLVRSIQIPMPDLTDRERLLAELKGSLDASARLESAIRLHRSRTEALRRALLAATFSGQLSRRQADAAVEELAGV